jgi:hypothetical protein
MENNSSNPRGSQLNHICIAFTAVAAFFVISRIIIRAKRKVLGFDDLWIVIALVRSLPWTW